MRRSSPTGHWSLATAHSSLTCYHLLAVSLLGMLKYVVKSKLRGVTMLKVGDRAPDFEVVDHEGNQVRLSGLRGRKVVLWFYPKADTPG